MTIKTFTIRNDSSSNLQLVIESLDKSVSSLEVLDPNLSEAFIPNSMYAVCLAPILELPPPEDGI